MFVFFFTDMEGTSQWITTCGGLSRTLASVSVFMQSKHLENLLLQVTKSIEIFYNGFTYICFFVCFFYRYPDWQKLDARKEMLGKT